MEFIENLAKQVYSGVATAGEYVEDTYNSAVDFQFGSSGSGSGSVGEAITSGFISGITQDLMSRPRAIGQIGARQTRTNTQARSDLDTGLTQPTQNPNPTYANVSQQSLVNIYNRNNFTIAQQFKLAGSRVNPTIKVPSPPPKTRAIKQIGTPGAIRTTRRRAYQPNIYKDES